MDRSDHWIVWRRTWIAHLVGWGLLCGLALIPGCSGQPTSSKQNDDAGQADKGSSSQAPNTSQSAGKRRIAVIPKSMSHQFWNAVEAGARKAETEFDVQILWKAPTKESDRAAQIQLVQQFVADQVDGIVLAPLDSRALVGPVRVATQAGIPVVIIDSGLEAQQGTDYLTFVGTNNTLGGKLGGEELVRILNGQGDVVLLRYMAGSASTTERETGFLSALTSSTGIRVISENRFAGTTSGEGQTAALNMMDVLRQAQGIFCPNESSTDGMLQALRKEGLAGKVRFVGFDTSPPLMEGLRQGEIDALVAQNPQQMGYLGVKALIDHAQGVTLPPMIDTGVQVLTRANLESVAP